jgi:hypothetical protein
MIWSYQTAGIRATWGSGRGRRPAAGYPGLSRQRGPHTFATNFLAHGHDIYALKEILGHPSTKAGAMQSRTTEERKEQGVANIPWNDYNRATSLPPVAGMAGDGST